MGVEVVGSDVLGKEVFGRDGVGDVATEMGSEEEDDTAGDSEEFSCRLEDFCRVTASPPTRGGDVVDDVPDGNGSNKLIK